jgi:hypothetical protein
MVVIRAVKVRVMTARKFKIGQIVLFRPKQRPSDSSPSNRPYRVMQILSAPVGEPQYRIRSTGSERELAARESELRPVQAHSARY